MAPDFKDHFSSVASQYRAFRPDYPKELFAWLAGTVSRHDVALDCGCGNGQASVALAEHFLSVVAVDPGEEQIRHAIAHPRVRYRVSQAETTGLPPESIDLTIVAQALHWFDLDRFYAEVRRLARGNAVLAAFTYGLVRVDATLDPTISRLYRQTLGDYWPPERRHVDSGYRELPFPFAEIVCPAFEISQEWSFEQLLGYLSTWSGLNEYRKRTGRDALAEIRPTLQSLWGSPERLRRISWPLTLRAGHIQAPRP